jgi:hypothetical protein
MESHCGQQAHYNHFPRRHAQHRRSSPIEIPTRRRSARNRRSPPRHAAASPELIFDMSPLEYALDPVLSTRRGAGACALQEDDRPSSPYAEQEPMYSRRDPFLYSFPMLSSHQSSSRLEPSAMSRSHVAPCRNVSDTPSNEIRGEDSSEMQCINQLRRDGQDSPSTLHTQATTLPGPAQAARTVTAPKHFGFQSAKVLTGYDPSRRSRSPLTTSLFRSCEPCLFEESALSCSPVDGDVGFESYLVQRIDERSVRVSHRQPISSVRLSVRGY